MKWLNKQVETFKKGINRQSTKAEYEKYSCMSFEFPKPVIEKRTPMSRGMKVYVLKVLFLKKNQKMRSFLRNWCQLK